MIKELLHQAIALLARREHSSKELQQKLLRRGYLLDDIKEVLQFVQEKNYQSDIRAADCIFRNRLSRGYGWQYIESEMVQKGVTFEIIDSIRQAAEIDWQHQAMLVYSKKYGDDKIVDQKEKAKRIRFLQYRGFSLDEIMSVVNSNSVNKYGCEHD